MICSDGLTSMVDDSAILEIVERNRVSLDRAARALVDAANGGGGEDNITIVAFELTEEPEERTVEQTRPLPAVGPDEDTLDELDAVPVIEEPKRRRRRSFVVLLLLLLLVAAAIVVWVLVR